MLGMELKEKLAALCKTRGVERYDLVDVVGDVSRSTIDNWFSGRTRPGLDAAFKVARALGVPLDFLADDAAEEPPPAELGVDEEMALDLYRELRKSVVRPAEAVLAIARLVASKTGEPVCMPALSVEPAEPGHGPATFLGRADLSESDANRRREENRPKKVGGGKPKPKVKNGGGIAGSR